MYRKRLCVRTGICEPPKISLSILSSREFHCHHLCVLPIKQPSSLRHLYLYFKFFKYVAQKGLYLTGVLRSVRWEASLPCPARRGPACQAGQTASCCGQRWWGRADRLHNRQMPSHPLQRQEKHSRLCYWQCFITTSWIFPKFRQFRYCRWHLIFNFYKQVHKMVV